MWRFLSIVFDLERTNQLNLLPDKDLVDLCPHIEPYQVTKNRLFFLWQDQHKCYYCNYYHDYNPAD
ncbi:MAG: hypothetical protein O9326_11305 [Microcystis sp. LE19-338.1B]|nr:hypothetical protein [Microcystis sp. LE19-338.1B]MCZ8357796.1 hypothetical protein [Microcystis sp. LE19-388.1G]